MGMYTEFRITATLNDKFRKEKREIYEYIKFKSLYHKEHIPDEVCDEVEEAFIKYLENNNVTKGKKYFFGSGCSSYFDKPFLNFEESENGIIIDCKYNTKDPQDDFKWWAKTFLPYANTIEAYEHYEEFEPRQVLKEIPLHKEGKEILEMSKGEMVPGIIILD